MQIFFSTDISPSIYSVHTRVFDEIPVSAQHKHSFKYSKPLGGNKDILSVCSVFDVRKPAVEPDNKKINEKCKNVFVWTCGLSK